MKKIIVFSLILSSCVNATTWFVDQNATGNNDGSSWLDAFTTIQVAVDLAMTNDAIYIAEGVYFESAEILVTQPIILQGGYPTGGGNQDFNNFLTIVDGSNSHRVINYTNTTATLELNGLIIQNGGNVNEGAGIRALNSSLLLKNTKVRNCNAGTNTVIPAIGGGINGAIITLVNSQVTNNGVGSVSVGLPPMSIISAWGGGIYGETISLINSQVMANSASSNSFDSNDIDANAYGGGIYATMAITLINSQVSNNSVLSAASRLSTANGGGISGGLVSLINSQVTDNTATTFTILSKDGFAVGGGIRGVTTLENSILWGNKIKEFEESIVSGVFNLVLDDFEEQYGGGVTANSSLIRMEYPVGNNNVDATVVGFDPLFVDSGNGDYHLQVGSPLLETGDVSLLPLDDYDVDNDGDVNEIHPIDIDGKSRVINALDIGVYERQEILFINGFE